MTSVTGVHMWSKRCHRWLKRCHLWHPFCHMCTPVTLVTEHMTILYCNILEGLFYRRSVRPENCTSKKCVHLWQKWPHHKTAFINQYWENLNIYFTNIRRRRGIMKGCAFNWDDVLGVLVSVFFWLKCRTYCYRDGTFCIWDDVSDNHKNMRICICILWINLARSFTFSANLSDQIFYESWCCWCVDTSRSTWRWMG